MKITLIVCFFIMCIAQWYVPGKMILDQEEVITEGKVFKFKTQPIDPTDPFRGKYITLNFDINSVGITDPKEWDNARGIYISVTDSAGFAQIDRVSLYEPDGEYYIKAEINYIQRYPPYTLLIRYPFERFYLEESKASVAERVYFESLRDSSRVTYAEVSIKKGKSALLDVKIGKQSISTIVSELNAKKDYD